MENIEFENEKILMGQYYLNFDANNRFLVCINIWHYCTTSETKEQETFRENRRNSRFLKKFRYKFIII